MMNSGRHRGFGYVKFLQYKEAKQAIDSMNNILKTPSCELQLSICKNLRQLWLWNLSYEFDVDHVIDLIQKKVHPGAVCILLNKIGFRWVSFG